MTDNLLSQEEIDALLSGADSDAMPSMSAPAEEPAGGGDSGSGKLTADQKKALVEISGILTNSSSTVLSTILNNQLDLTNPVVNYVDAETLKQKHAGSGVCVVEVPFNEGLTGRFSFVVKRDDLMIIADLMMGNDGTSPPAEMDEIYLSAAEEAFNQMMGSATTSLSSMFNTTVEVGQPKLHQTDLYNEDLGLGQDLVEISFSFKMGDLIDSELYQVLPLKLATEMARVLTGVEEEPEAPEPAAPAMDDGSIDINELTAMLGGDGGAASEAPQMPEAPPQGMPDSPGMGQPAAPPQGMPGYPPQGQPGYPPQGQPGYPPQGQPGYPPQGQPGYPPQGQPGYPPPGQPGYPPQGQPGYPPQGYGYPGFGMPSAGVMPGGVPVQNVQFQSLTPGNSSEIPSNIDLIMDVPLQIVVELGRTKKLIRDILELGAGSVVELDRLAGESVDVLVNGKLIAKGEVVVIDENFGIRITNIVSPAERIKRLEEI